MKVTILKDSVYSHQNLHIPVSKGDIVELPEFIERVWLGNGICEECKPKVPKKETKVVNPVVETKAPAKNKKVKK